MTSQPHPTVRFKENLTDFFNHVISICNEHEGKIAPSKGVEALRDLIVEYPTDTVMMLFIDRTHSHWNAIKERDASVFKMIQDVLKAVPIKDISNTNMLYDILTLKEGNNYVVSEEDRNIMWEYGEAFASILIDYVHLTRCPKTRKLPNGQSQAVYTKQFLPHFNIRTQAKTWSVDLQF